MTTIIFVIGLPGSGKSTYIRNQYYGLDNIVVFDDFKDDAIADCNLFPYSQSFVKLINSLNVGKTCIVCDIDFCREEARRDAVRVLEKLTPEVVINWVFFENDPEQCRVNLEQSESPRKADKLRALANYSKQYQVPGGCEALKVWVPNSPKQSGN